MNFKPLCLRHAAVFSAVVVLLTANCLVAQSPARVAAKSERGTTEEDAPGVPAITPLPSLAQPVFPPKPSRKDERLTRAEVLYEEGYKYYVLGDHERARKQFDEALDLVLNSKSDSVNRSIFDKRFEELVQKIYRTDVDTAQSGKILPAAPSFDKAPIDDILSLTFPMDPKLKSKVREEIGATVSQLPLEAPEPVLSFINYFNGERGKRTLVAGLRRSGRYKQMISRILDEEGIPQEFIFLAQAESGFLPRAMSYMAAGGMWQFIRDTGARYGLKQDGFVDERFDPELATRAAARHLRDLYHEFGDWYLAIAAYNCGQGAVDKAVEKTGYADVWELRSRGTLPLETSNYVPIILAMTIMSKNPKNYGLEDLALEDPLLYDNVEVNATTSLTLIADILGLPVSELRDLNPALLKDVAPAKYRLHVPRGSINTLMTGLERVPVDKRPTWRVHRTQPGDTLASIATRYSATPAALQSANPNMDATELTAGSLLVVPSTPRPVYVARAPVRRYTAAAKPRATVAGNTRPAAKPAPKAAAPVRKQSTTTATKKQTRPHA